MEARDLLRDHEALVSMHDARLLAHIGLVHDELAQAWNVACIGNMIAGGALAAAERVGAAADLAAGIDERLVSADALLGVDELARYARDAPRISALLDDALAAGISTLEPTLGSVRDVAPWWAARFDELVRAVGHRGPGETELENSTYGDRPELLLATVAKAVHVPVRPGPSTATPTRAAKLAADWSRSRCAVASGRATRSCA